MSHRIGIALFGFGRAGLIHFRNAISNHRLNLLYIVELNTDHVNKTLAEFNQDKVKVISAADAETVYNDDRVQAVVVCTTTYAHEDIVKKALQHGKGVFCEKPISGNVSGTKACYEEAERAGKPLFCSFNRRFDPTIRLLRESIQKENVVGQIQVVKICSRDNPVPSMDYLRNSGGIFHDCIIHDVDMICWLLQEFPTSVFTHAHAHCPEIKEMNDVDTVAIVMKFPSGVIGTIDVSRHSPYGYDQRIEVFGSKGMVESGNQRAHGLASHTSAGTAQGCYHYSFPQRYAESYKLAMEHFLDVLIGADHLEVTEADILLATQVVNACEDSAKSTTAVELNLGVSS